MLETILKFADLASFAIFSFFGIRLIVIQIVKDICRHLTGFKYENKAFNKHLLCGFFIFLFINIFVGIIEILFL